VTVGHTTAEVEVGQGVVTVLYQCGHSLKHSSQYGKISVAVGTASGQPQGLEMAVVVMGHDGPAHAGNGEQLAAYCVWVMVGQAGLVTVIIWAFEARVRRLDMC
jgi:hypothetical protein